MITTKHSLTKLSCLVALLLGGAGFESPLYAQGCVAARGAGVSACQLGQHGDLLPPDTGFQASVSYRWLDSHRHFVGDVEQKQREAEGSQVINHSHFIDLGMTYAFNPRISATLTLPFVIHDRSQVVRSNDVNRTILERFHTQSSSVSDLRIEGSCEPREGA